jgi:hypothetical protein
MGSKRYWFFTHVLPSVMPVDCAKNFVSKDLKLPVKFQAVPIPIPVRVNLWKKPTKTYVYGIEIKTKEINDMISILKENRNPGTFIPF